MTEPTASRRPAPAPPESLGERIRRLRRAQALTQAQLARGAGCAQSQVSAWELGLVPSLESAIRLARALSVTLDALVGGAR